MKFILFNGSPAKENSATNIIATAFFAGARKAGAECESIFLLDKNIGHCNGCFACWFQTPGKCVMQDDMTELLQKYTSADVVCFGTPVYTWNMTAALKNFADRLAPLKSPLIVQDEGNFDLADARKKEQKFVVISNCGFPGENNFETMKVVFQSCNPVLEIYRNCGKLLKSKDDSVQQIVSQYLKVVEQAGFELASKQFVTDETKKALEMQLMTVPAYVKYLGM